LAALLIVTPKKPKCFPQSVRFTAAKCKQTMLGEDLALPET